MGSSEARKVLAGFGIATLLAGVALTGCKSAGG
jgi:radical SAM modification target selenobiotic family peptide